MRASTAPTVETAICSFAAIAVLVIRNRRNRSITASTRAGVRFATLLGADDRSSSTRSPDRQRLNHSYARRSLMPAASAASATVQCSSVTRWHNNRR